MKFKFYITEIYSTDVTVEANSEEEAYEKVEEMCNNDEIDVVSPEFFSERNIELDEWGTRMMNESKE